MRTKCRLITESFLLQLCWASDCPVKLQILAELLHRQQERSWSSAHCSLLPTNRGQGKQAHLGHHNAFPHRDVAQSICPDIILTQCTARESSGWLFVDSNSSSSVSSLFIKSSPNNPFESTICFLPGPWPKQQGLGKRFSWGELLQHLRWL